MEYRLVCGPLAFPLRETCRLEQSDQLSSYVAHLADLEAFLLVFREDQEWVMVRECCTTYDGIHVTTTQKPLVNDYITVANLARTI